MTASRQARIQRDTSETQIAVAIDLDGHGRADVDSGIGFFDHMLTALAKHGGFDLEVRCQGDLHIDGHHTVEDIGIALGKAFSQAIGDKRGITRFGHALVPLDEALSEAVVDISGRPYLAWNVVFQRERIGEMDTDLFEEFYRAFAMSASMAVHMTCKAGRNAHHIAESGFKAFARALRMAVMIDPRSLNTIPSTKGVL
ncbi:imidazoleglycerol-phosphate dehydratase HisB [Kozakia baliensis]|uniref:Imidazoleglycerol-phosphate dehydratase n=1 Tax=Kozakia baliensis TaxID=153496 RepID=A0A1D8USU3_9PROT|nr:imidazoleglycerol-phosphate dehydratase HisB [Kozakia baliensis]AOX16708.1 imidazoleglycerol-phosphate dehydratase [Kozakia baliensis]AOX19966.1 imidazoleglycerol-phosphate dehydratase [Kozakia baliensis]GEL64818.1 imidazoleglycerol-phosphate dehydratase [Kozakia baliensis]